MSAALNLFRNMFPDAVVTAAAPANHEDTHPIRAYVDAVKRGLTRKPIAIGGGVSIFFRTVAALKKTPGEYLFKFTFEHNNDEIPDLELVLYCGIDDMIGLFQARKIRAVSSTQQYRHTMKDESAVLSSDPKDVCADLKRKLGVNGELNHLVLDLYKQAIRHLATRHPENAVETPEKLTPFDYAMEIRRVLHGKPIHIDNDVTAKFAESTSLKEGNDVVLKFDLTLSELTKPVPDLQLLLYATTDNDTEGVGIRKIRIKSVKLDYSDSEKDEWVALPADPVEAASDLLENLQGGPLGDTAREMARRATYQLNGGIDAELEAPEPQVQDDDQSGGGIDWAELGIEDPTR